VDTPYHRSAAPGGDQPKLHPDKLSAELPVPARTSLNELRQEWRRLYHCEPRRISRDLLVRGIGYRRWDAGAAWTHARH
jgi:hypothetical protein